MCSLPSPSIHFSPSIPLSSSPSLPFHSLSLSLTPVPPFDRPLSLSYLTQPLPFRLSRSFSLSLSLAVHVGVRACVYLCVRGRECVQGQEQIDNIYCFLQNRKKNKDEELRIAKQQIKNKKKK